MDHVKDLKKLRDEALGRLQDNPDYRTLRALTALIDDLTLMDASRAPVGDLPQSGKSADNQDANDLPSTAVMSNGKGPGRVANFTASTNASSDS
ncbi:MAG: hypothetical protein AAGH82_05830 [Pseudomonadota bacterium]